SISGTTPVCNSTTLSYTHGAGQPQANVAYYWQTTATGTSTTSNANNTYNATTSGTYYVRAFNTATSCWSLNAVSYTVEVNNTPNITAQPPNQDIQNGSNTTFSITANNAISYQWQVSTDNGGSWTNLSNGAPYSGVTTETLTLTGASLSLHNNQYRCVVSASPCPSTTSNAGILTVNNIAPNNAQSLSSCFLDDAVTLSWNHPATPPDGYVIFALEGTTPPTTPTLDATNYAANSNFTAAPFETPISLGKTVYKGTGTTATITGLNEDNTYSFRIFAYNGETQTGWSNGNTAGSNAQGLAQADVTNLTATPNTNQVNLAWNNPLPTACFDELIIVANQGTVSFTPSGSYASINTPYAVPNSVVYATTATVSTKAISGLTNELNYCFKIFIRRGTIWSEGVEVCATPTLSYCDAYGSTSYDTGITGVFFNTINNSVTSSNNSYTDYTSLSTDVELGSTHNLSVHVEVDGNGTVYTKAWIDWNQDGTFNNTTEAYDLGDAYNVVNAPTTNSPLGIEVPSNAALGSTKMRIATKWDSHATPCDTGYGGEVEDYTINVMQPSGPEINIKGGSISIPNGFNTPYGLNNTLFAATPINNDGDTKTFTIENFGLTALTLTGSPLVEITGDHPTDFIVDVQPNATVPSSGQTTFSIRFHPTLEGVRTAIVRLLNSDSNESPYQFTIQGSGVCSAVITSTILPTSGPENTEITITSATNLTNATASINGIPMPIVSSTSAQLVVSVPNGATSGNISVLLNTGCTFNNAFTVIDNTISNCDALSSATTPANLFISEVSDATSGSSSLVELFNGTGAPIDLSDYVLKVYNNGSSSASSSNALTGTLANNDVYVVALGSTSCDLPSNGLSNSPNQTFSSSSGINFNNDSSDAIVLEKVSGDNPGEIDIFGVKNSNSWANTLGIGDRGVNFKRKNDAPNLPSMSFLLSDWDMVDWTSCDDSDYAGFGNYDFSVGIPPAITLQPTTPVAACYLAATLTVNGSEGYDGAGDTQDLAYQWYYAAPSHSGWTAVNDNAIYTGSTTNTLSILDTSSLNNYQFYCQVREDDEGCFTASNAIKIHSGMTVWDGTTWSNGIPDHNTVAIIDNHYNTGTNGSFEACSLTVNDGWQVVIADEDNGSSNTYIEVANDVKLIGSASMLVHPKAAFVQLNDSGLVTADNADNYQVNKTTAPMNNWYEYTYWSSPVSTETIAHALSTATPNRRFRFSAQDYRDSYKENNNSNTFNIGQDGVDDDPDYFTDGTGADWQLTSGSDIMTPGVGYISTHRSDLFGQSPCNNGPNCQFTYSFKGLFNNGIVTVWMYRNDEETNDLNWNLLGNPYPSAISADAFLNYNADIASATNPVVDGAIYLWSQNTPPDGNTSGNETLNFSQSDYAVINGVGETGSAPGGDGSDPSNRMIPSGQAFFVAMSDSAPGTQFHSNPSADPGDIVMKEVVFNNAMRVRGTSDNSQFYRMNNNSSNPNPNKIWLDLTSDNGAYNQILIGYVNGATNGLDNMYYDAPMAVTNVNAVMYSTIENVQNKFTIQGKVPEALNLDEVIPLGFKTSINVSTLYTLSISRLEGPFLNTNTIYLKDNLLNTYHNLSTSNYTFTSAVGEFNSRFELVFKNPTLTNEAYELPNFGLTIIEFQNNQVQFSVDKKHTMTSITIIDLLGRTVYRLPGNNSHQVTHDLSGLSSSVYMAKVHLANGQIVYKKALKK
ncbi:MAG: choice-of-anchor D domain-containing protein, partial [Algicola sp.]|nr:choice-of-anchor D domain-containing protein [Algicola sp.]